LARALHPISHHSPEHVTMFIAFLAVIIVTGAALGMGVVHALRIR